MNGLFSAKKDETFILLEDDAVHYLIGLGKQPKNFEMQSVAEKFSYDFRKKIKSENTLINSEKFNSDQIESLIKGLFIGTYGYPFKAEHPIFKSKFQFILNSVSDENLKEIKLKTLAICAG